MHSLCPIVCRYNNLVWAIAAIFGDLPADSPILVLLEDALKDLPTEEAEVINFSIDIEW